ncbi:glycyl-tRNA synthetase beta chain [Psychromonas ingrahamii 37]|uniref:Glycine--tRNA ligase beta subunit n=1 Tax=Psychromonas ingrahamii (strain DSM 17664 / CCUG 51855 / 37) TaxID=357804 RepID=SYGB_PSYIN|nr:glycine--tRNA ligase subunit beta [Psychromonas ingrahamii]A1T0Y5.1 RecName: Full=Glycine--tRNA ligase beta subunit; AltName: Full=Glycyl-tRNA synthetase beta subunit; Short=GlyRS [Psychromonas ingrahamii 37]ABM05400.1 glycyl-tRNA synthetase beta chain [Psychromonas ingrahamii 37]
MAQENLLIELGTEELPPKSLRQLAESFASNVEAELNKAELSFDSVRWLASPRRLALVIANLSDSQADKIVEKRGPAVNVAFDAEGQATKAAQGWARSNGITVEQAERLITDKGEWLLFKSEVKGLSVAELIPEIAANALAKLPISKPMRWGSSSTQFIRPVHTVTMLFGSRLIQGELLGVASDRIIRGHRFLGEAELIIDHADQYETLLDDSGKVIVDYERRKAIIRDQVEALAAHENGVADIDESLLEEVTSLVEWPVTLVGSFEDKFLDVPSEALIYTMKDNQKYFPVLDKDGKLLPRFIFVSNIVSRDPAQVISGNEKVIRPRLADAEFFFETDKKKTLASRLESLSSVLFQQKLGTLKEKSERIANVAEDIALQIKADTKHAQRAGLLSKTDLMTDMVMEFPDVQGIMGMHYALHDGEEQEVAIALNEQYLPRFAGDKLPTSLVACAVSLADKLDTLVGIFGIGQAPKGAADPFALRRAAIGLLRIITNKNLDLDLVELVEIAKLQYGHKLTNDNVVQDVVDFLFARFRATYQANGYSVELIQSVLVRRPTKPVDFEKRLQAVAKFQTLPEAAPIAAANKRISNILAKVKGEINAQVDPSLLQEPAEIKLSEILGSLESTLRPLFDNLDYESALFELASLNEPVDEFFDNVMVMAEDPAIKANRLAILNRLRNLFLQIADVSVL